MTSDNTSPQLQLVVQGKKVNSLREEVILEMDDCIL